MALTIFDPSDYSLKFNSKPKNLRGIDAQPDSRVVKSSFQYCSFLDKNHDKGNML